MKTPSLTTYIVLIHLAATTAAFGELRLAEDVPLPQTHAAYENEAVPTPEAVLGFHVGARHSEPHQIVAYYEAVAEASDRVVVHEHGRTYQGRPMVHAIVTSPANHEQLDAIRAANQRLGDAPGEVDASALTEQPAVIYLGYSVHGNEASGAEAALLMLYHLAAGEGDYIDAVLDNLVLVLEPAMNPDGRHRFTSWVNGNRGATPVTDPQNREHREPWPNGRTNHYWFDPNRDYLAVRHPEGRARLGLLNEWRPQIVCDIHEMGGESSYHFQPGVPERVNPRTPKLNQELTREIAGYHSRILGEVGELFFTREVFDDFFAGKGSTYPDITGGIGILYEQASSRALTRETDNHGELTYSYSIRNHFATSLSTVQAALEMRSTLLDYQRDFFAQVPALADEHPVKAYIVPIDEDRTRAQTLLRLILRHRIQIHDLAEPIEADDRTYQPGEAVLIPLAQPQFRLIRSLMETQTEFSDDRFYDVSTWTKPLAFGVDAAELHYEPEPYLGELIEAVELDGGHLVGGRADYAYLMRWNRYFAPRALYRLQEAGFQTRVLRRPVVTDIDGEPTPFARGTIVIPVDYPAHNLDADTDLHALIEQLVADDHVQIYATGSQISAEGPDLGSRNFASILTKPNIALLTGSGASTANAGEVWHLLDYRFQMPVTLLDVNRARGSRLDRYDRLILAGGSYGSLRSGDVEQWIRDGGTLIATDSGARWVIRQDWVDLSEKDFDMDELLHGQPFEQLSDIRGAQRVGGSIFEAELDTTHPIAYGYEQRVPLFRNSNIFYEPYDQPGRTVASYTDQPLLSGYISDEQAEQVPGSPAVIARTFGRGQIVLIMDNPNFRNFWYGTNGLFLNAIFFGDTF